MPPPLAALLCLVLTVTLLRWDAKHREKLSSATWIPTLWLLVIGSRSVTQWLYLGTPDEEIGAGIEQGSALDRNYFLFLIVCSLIVLIRRGVLWQRVTTLNGWFVFFLLYCLISVTWSDFPLVSLKRWFKAVGDPLMVLVLLTERNPAVAITTVLRRIAFILIPLSVVFIKYFPLYGRTYSPWSGEATYTGVTTNKNLLGYLLFVTGLLFLCTWLERKRIQDLRVRKVETWICLLFLFLVGYLFNLANSMTALLAFATAAMIAIAVNKTSIRQHIGAIAIVLFAVTWALMGTNLSAALLSTLGRDASLTGRTDLWAAVLPMAVNPLLGAGFESFWLGERLSSLWSQFAFRPNQAHNGYIDMYLQLGVIGLTIFTIFVLSSFRALRRTLMDTYGSLATMNVDQIIVARFAIGYVIAMVAYNVTEATFRSLNFLFVLLLLVAVRYPHPHATESNLVTVRDIRRRKLHGSPKLHDSATGETLERNPIANRAWAFQRRRAVRFTSRQA